MSLSNQKSNKGLVKSRLLALIDNLSDESLEILIESAKKLPLKGDRKELRKICSINVDITAHNQEVICSIHDISYSGVFVQTDLPMPFGSEISLSFSVEGVKKPLEITGQVTRTSHKGIGVKFRDLTQQQEDVIRSFVDFL